MNKSAMKRTLAKTLGVTITAAKNLLAIVIGLSLGAAFVLAVDNFPVITISMCAVVVGVACFIDTYLHECKKDENRIQ